MNPSCFSCFIDVVNEYNSSNLDFHWHDFCLKTRACMGKVVLAPGFRGVMGKETYCGTDKVFL